MNRFKYLYLFFILSLLVFAGCKPAEEGTPETTTPTTTTPTTTTPAASTAKDISAFSFTATANSALSADVTATITGTAITATVPYGTNVTALVPTFTTTGSTVNVGTTAQTSGTTANDFTSAVTYKVAAADATTQSYTVTVSIASNTVVTSATNDITAFTFTGAANGALTTDVTTTISGTNITATVPFGTNVTALVPTFTTTGSTVNVSSTAQTSGTTANDFTSAVTYTVVAADATTQVYTVTVTVASASASEITAFSFPGAINVGFSTDAVGTISTNAIAVTVPSGATLSVLAATFTTTGSSVTATVAGSAVPQTSGTTVVDFTSPVTYTVTAADTTTTTYTVTVTVAPATTKAITAFSFPAATNPAITADVTATISGFEITATVPAGTNLTSLAPEFATTGASVTVGGNAQSTTGTVNDYSAPLTYVVTAADASVQNYTVTVTAATSSAKEITAFSFTNANNPVAFTQDTTATITGLAIAAKVRHNADVNTLTATFSSTGSSVKVGAVDQVSGTTTNNFTTPVNYLVTGSDASAQTYAVSVQKVIPAAGSIVIDAAAAYTTPDKALLVSVALTASDETAVTGYCLKDSATAPALPAANDACWTTVNAASYTGTVAFTLANTYGNHVVYAWFRDADGNVSDAINDAIGVKGTVFSETFTNTGAAALSNTTTTYPGRAWVAASGQWQANVGGTSARGLGLLDGPIGTHSVLQMSYTDFATDTLAAGNTLEMTFITKATTGNLFNSAGKAGISLHTGASAGVVGTEKLFVGSYTGVAYWGVQIIGGSHNGDIVTTEAATAVFTYNYDTGACSLTVNGTQLTTCAAPANLQISGLGIWSSPNTLTADATTIDIDDIQIVIKQ